MERKYSNIFSLLVRNQSDIVGHIAYALYKSEKANYIEHFCAINNRKPTDDELSIFHDISSQPDSDALVTTLAAKDRVLGHNPLAAIYCEEGYFKDRIL